MIFIFKLLVYNARLFIITIKLFNALLSKRDYNRALKLMHRIEYINIKYLEMTPEESIEITADYILNITSRYTVSEFEGRLLVNLYEQELA